MLQASQPEKGFKNVRRCPSLFRSRFSQFIKAAPYRYGLLSSQKASFDDMPE